MRPNTPWTVSERDYPFHGRPAQKLTYVARYALLAPSRNNDQPWLFEIGRDSLILRRDRSRALPVADPDGREAIMSCGAALLNLRVALAHFDLGHELILRPDPATPDVLVVIRLTGEPSHDDDLAALFPALPRRHSVHGPFLDRPLPDGLLAAMQEAVVAEGAWMRNLSDARQAVLGLVAEGDHVHGRDPAYRRELAAWIRSSGKAHDGLPKEAVGFGPLGKLMGPLAVRSFDWGPRQAARDEALVLQAPALVVIGTDADTSGEWLGTGQAIERALLVATAEGVAAGWFNQVTEVAALRERLSVAAGRPGRPQTVLRLGYPPQEQRPTPRRDLEEVLVPPPA